MRKTAPAMRSRSGLKERFRQPFARRLSVERLEDRWLLTAAEWASADHLTAESPAAAELDGRSEVAPVRSVAIESAEGEGEQDEVPVIRLTQDVGYARISQTGLHLEAGTRYVFSCRIRGSFQGQSTDKMPELWSTHWVEPSYSETLFYQSEGWTTALRTITPQVTSDYDLKLALWSQPSLEVTDLNLRVDPSDPNLLQNGDLSAGLEHWQADGGQIQWTQVPLHPPAAEVLDDELVQYTRFDGQTESLRAFQGESVILLVPQDQVFAVDPGQVREILRRLDLSWEYYLHTMGREPPLYGDRITMADASSPPHLPTLAVVESSCGAGCGLVGAASLEIGVGIWQETYQNAVSGGETRGVFEYEMGRNYWLYGSVFHAPDVPSYHLATAFATIFGYQAGVAGGSTQEPGHELVDWVASYRAAFDAYLQAPNWRLIRDGGQSGEKIVGGLWLYLEEQYGSGFHARFFRQANQLAAAANLDEAVSNYIIAASVAAGQNLVEFFVDTLAYPEVAGLPDRVDQMLAGLPVPDAVADHYVLFNDGKTVALGVIDNDQGGVGDPASLVLYSASEADHGGQAAVSSGSSLLLYSPAAGFYGDESFTYTVGNDRGAAGQAVVTVEVLKRWHNASVAHDVDANRAIEAQDVLLVINALNGELGGKLPVKPPAAMANLSYLDVSDDGSLTPLDALQVINEINRGPVAPPDDSYEQNDSLLEAAELGTVGALSVLNDLRLSDPADWFRFTLPSPGAVADWVAIDFDGQEGDLDLRLYDSQAHLLGSSLGVGDREQISLFGLGPGTFYAEVTGFQGHRNSYSLLIQPPGPRPDLVPGYFDAGELCSWGSALPIQAIVFNMGRLDAGPSAVSLFLSRDAHIDATDTLLGQVSLDAIAVSNFSSIQDLGLTLPASPPAGYPDHGVLYVGMIVDAGEQIEETDESNNGMQTQGVDLDAIQVAPR